VVEAKSPAVKAAPTKIPTTLTISAPSSVKVKQSFSITGKLTANGAPLTKSIIFLQRLNGKTWITLAAQTAITGTYSFSRTETTTYQYRTTYAGSASYASATSPTVFVTAVEPTPNPNPNAHPNSNTDAHSVSNVTDHPHRHRSHNRLHQPELHD
jgi:hypothetical protein